MQNKMYFSIVVAVEMGKGTAHFLFMISLKGALCGLTKGRD
jgi:hypothetical protein